MLHYCIIGHPVAHSLSPQIHNAAFKALKISADFVKEDVLPEDLESFMRGFRNKYAGASVTIPHKEAVMKFLDEIDPQARKIGAVNTVLNKNSRLIGYNTDCYGAMQTLRSVIASLSKAKAKQSSQFLANKRVCILGAGGAARAVLYGCLQAGARVTILNRTVEKAQKLAEEFNVDFGALTDFRCEDFDVIINTTSCGMHPHDGESPVCHFERPAVARPQVSEDGEPRNLVVMDIIYAPLKTKLIKDAKKAGCKIITGDRMLLYQACKAFEIWTGEKAPKEAMEFALNKALALFA